MAVVTEAVLAVVMVMGVMGKSVKERMVECGMINREADHGHADDVDVDVDSDCGYGNGPG